MRVAGVPHETAAEYPALGYVRNIVVPAALAMLPPRMDSQLARVQLLAIGLQESRFKYRRQIRGPALSFWQAESGGGFCGLLEHRETRAIARDVLQRMAYGEPDHSDFQAIEDNDILACIGARLLLWTHPASLPTNPESAWAYYLATWRPGKPHPATWRAFYQLAWQLEEEGGE